MGGDAVKQVKITGIRRGFFPELAQRYLTEGEAAGPCPRLEGGDTFVFTGGAVMPEGFCPWARHDICLLYTSRCV